jgi:hypothetical protein
VEQQDGRHGDRTQAIDIEPDRWGSEKKANSTLFKLSTVFPA